MIQHHAFGSALVAIVLVVLSGACARQGRPSGGPEDQRPPVVVSTFPEAFSIISELDASVRFDFDERISETASGTTLDQAISISPRGGEVTVKHSRRSLSLEVEGGFEPGIVYRVTLQPVVADLFGNRLVDPFELVFSTGGEPVATTLAGEVWNRITGQPLDAATVFAVGADGLVHQSVTNRAGIFAFRYVPDGQFNVTAFDDVDRDFEVDSMEVQGAVPTELSAGDTVLVDVPVLAPDTASAVVSGASVIDSVTVVVTFDDFLDPDRSVDGMTIRMNRDGGTAPSIARRFHEAEYAGYVEVARDSLARLDSIAMAEVAAEAAAQAATAAAEDSLAATDSTAVPVLDTTAAPDSTEVAADPVDTLTTPQVGAPTGGRPGPGQRAAPPARAGPTTLDPLPGSRPGPTADGRRILPSRRIVLQLDGPLEFDVEYEIQVEEAVNINGLGGGGGVTELLRETPPPPDTTVVDTLAVDTLAVDTMIVDTLAVDTLGVVSLLFGRGR